jgi:hypothetical protein
MARIITVLPAQSLHPEGSLQAAGQWYGPEDGERIETEPIISESDVSGNQDSEVLFECAATTSATSEESSDLKSGFQSKRKRCIDKYFLPNTIARSPKTTK